MRVAVHGDDVTFAGTEAELKKVRSLMQLDAVNGTM